MMTFFQVHRARGSIVIIGLLVGVAAAAQHARTNDVALDSTGVVLQREANDCGIAALATFARRYGVTVDANRLRHDARVTAAGINLLTLLTMAGEHGISMRAVFVDTHGPPPPAPWIAHMNRGSGHYVVVERVQGDNWTVADPARGRRRYSARRFRSEWSGYALLPAAASPGGRDRQYGVANPDPGSSYRQGDL